MLARIGIDMGALTVDDRDLAAAQECHRSALQVLMNHGVLVLPRGEERTSLHGAVRELPVQIRKVWEVAMARLPMVSASVDCHLSEMAHIAQLSAWAGHIDVAALETVRAWELGVPPDRPSAVDPQSKIEVTRFDTMASSKRISDARDLDKNDIRPGQTRETVFDQRIRPHLWYARQVTIVDRYAGEELARCANRDVPRWRSECVGWFVDQLRGEHLKKVTLVTAPAEGRTTNTVVKWFRDMVAAAGSPDVEYQLSLVPEHAFRDEAHARHIRFASGETGHAVQLEKGLGPFNDAKMGQFLPCRSLAVGPSRQRERSLRAREISFVEARPSS